ncbi:sensor histidine kinase [Alkalicoccobacillus gibsonii]|uniref:Sensor histidine kinase n=1 Tax=Alkalicoccobacillus gibsonii TaxID=79881 RepID=A0ABU9VN90_9BACI
MKRKTMKDEIIRSFIKYAIIIVAIILVIYLLSLYLIFRASIVNPNQEMNQQIATEIEFGFNEYREGVAQFVQDDAIRSFLTKKTGSSTVNQRLYDFRNNQQMFANFVLLDADEEIVATSYYEEIYEELDQSAFLKEFMDKAQQDGLIEERLTKQMKDIDSDAAYVFAGALTDESQQPIGYLFFFLGNQLPSTNNHLLFITDPYDNVIFHSRSFPFTTLGKLELEQGHYIQSATDYFYKTRSTISENQIQVVTLTPINAYRLLLLYGLLTMIVSSLLMILVIWIVTPKILKKSLQPFDALVTMISNKNQNQHFQLEHMYDEVQTIYEEYTSRVHEINSLVDQNQKIMEKTRLSEMKHLEAKFNPHFLFNVLEMIKYEILSDPESAATMIVKTAKLMRYNINFGETTVPLEKDLNYLEDYFSLQKMRYGGRLTYHIQVDPSVYNAQIPKLMIQPLIENAIKHNINLTKHLHVELIISVLDDAHLLIQVRDNGCGIEVEDLSSIYKILSEEVKVTEHTGLKNTHQLIQLLYGKEYGLEIATKCNEGTVITLRIPFKG